MLDTFRDSFVGQIIYYASRRRLLQYPEERPDFELPDKYKTKEKKSRQSSVGGAKQKKQGEKGSRDASGGDVERGQPDRRTSDDTVVARNESREGGEEREGQEGQEGQGSEDDAIIVDWYGPDDPENPKNWSIYKKSMTVALLMALTSGVYMGSSIWTPGIEQGVEYFGLPKVTVTLGLTLFVAGYGIGPLFLSPITEIPHVGRTIPYIVCLAIFTVLQVPTALVTNFAGFCILRFIAGFVGSPPLATGGASISDIFAPHKVPYALGLWGLSAGAAPALAPIIAAFAVEANGWRWAFWIMLWMSGGTLLLLLFFLPETSGETILLRRAERLRKLTGNDRIHSQGEIETKHMSTNEIVSMSLLRPLSMSFTEPIVLSLNLYVGLIYAVLYSYFESFPIVYGPGGYGFSLGVSTLPFASLLVGAIISYAVYATWNRLYFEPLFLKKRGKVAPEARLPMFMAAAFCFPICLFWFGWTANRTHWISPVIASSFFGLGTSWMFLPALSYLPGAYPKYAASVLASNDFVRSMMGAAMPIVANPLFGNLGGGGRAGIAWGNTLLGCLTVLFIPVPFILYRAGPWLRSKSPRALHDDQIEEMPEDDSLPERP